MQRRVAIITGAGTGIGLATSLSLARRGYAIALAGRRADRLADAARAVESAGGAGLAIETDVTDETSVAHLFATTAKTFGRVDLLFNNAGHAPSNIPLEDLPLAVWRRIVEVNLTGSFICLREAYRIMKDQDPQGGRIINNGSLSAHVPRPDAIAYTASKHAVTGLTRTASLDGRKYDIACGQIDIGNSTSDMVAAAATGVKQASGAVITEPVMDAAHVGEAVAYMDSLPLSANVQFMTVLPTQMPFIGRG